MVLILPIHALHIIGPFFSKFSCSTILWSVRTFTFRFTPACNHFTSQSLNSLQRFRSLITMSLPAPFGICHIYPWNQYVAYLFASAKDASLCPFSHILRDKNLIIIKPFSISHYRNFIATFIRTTSSDYAIRTRSELLSVVHVFSPTTSFYPTNKPCLFHSTMDHKDFCALTFHQFYRICIVL